MCSSLGQEMIGGDIAEHNLNRVLIAACTPTLHEKTFRETLQSAGLNPYLLEQANVREHVAWVHTHEREKAQKKARSLIRMGLAKSALLEPLEPKEMDVEPKAVIIGGGLAGMRSALDLARRGFEVHILELSPSIGGGVALSDTVDKGVSSQEQVSSLMDEVLKEPKITIDTLANIKGFEGFIGNFNLRYQLKPRHVKEGCTACLKCMEVCPVDTENEYDYSLSKRKAIYLPFDFAYPKIPVIDMKTCTKCGECVKTCPEGVI
ncbi:MAG: 4Fe-4S binding protein, partial [Candidatus Hydrothermarchaeales archaeon]